VGDVTPEKLRAAVAESAFARWSAPGQGAVAHPVLPPPGRPPRGFVLVDRPGAPQSQVALSLALPAAASADRAALDAAATVLAGAFSSRLNLEARGSHGYSYGVEGGIAWHRGPSLLELRAAVRADATVPASGDFRLQLARIALDPPNPSELELAKAQLLHGVTGWFETMSSAAHAIGELHALGLPLDWPARYAAEVRTLTIAQVRRALAAHFDPSRAALVVVGDRSAVEPLVTVEHRDAEGRSISR
jgi:predicted Zn-dependent peptidase